MEGVVICALFFRPPKKKKKKSGIEAPGGLLAPPNHVTAGQPVYKDLVSVLPYS